MTPELRLVVALVSHGNAQLRGTPCSCGLSEVEGADSEGIREWRSRLSDPSSKRLWAAHFQSDSGPGRWAIELEGGDGSEVWLAQVDESAENSPTLDKLFFNVPELTRSLSLTDATLRLRQAAQGHSQAEAWLNPNDADPQPALPHLLPTPGLGPEADRLAHTALRILLSLPPDGTGSPLRGASLGALLAAIHVR